MYYLPSLVAFDTTACRLPCRCVFLDVSDQTSALGARAICDTRETPGED